MRLVVRADTTFAVAIRTLPACPACVCVPAVPLDAQRTKPSDTLTSTEFVTFVDDNMVFWGETVRSRQGQQGNALCLLRVPGAAASFWLQTCCRAPRALRGRACGHHTLAQTQEPASP